ncbi:MAG: S41 family peptidase [Sphingomonas sp.]|jgi:hypothetical protein|uniref:S41 family peptidase n=1 Tax=Sphingomonas sp. TaxID=28214 RepID=UPI00356320B8
MNRRAFLAVSATGLAVAGGAAALGQERSQPDLAKVVTTLADLLERGYVVPATGTRYAAMLRGKLAGGSYSAIGDADALAVRLTNDLAAVSPDRHLRVMNERALPSGERPAARHINAPASRSTPVPAAAPRRPGRAAIEDAGWIAPGVGYLRFTGFPDDPANGAQCETFMHEHATARTLIIDCRYNGGGGIVQMNAILPFLYDRETTLVRMEMVAAVAKVRGGTPFDGEGSVRAVAHPQPGIVAQEHFVVPRRDETRLFNVPLYYLVSNRTASAAEHLALALKRTKRATLIGETTAGANHFGAFEAIGAGLVVFLPVGRTIDPDTGKDWEGDGIAPDVAVTPTTALQEALKRTGMAV